MSPIPKNKKQLLQFVSSLTNYHFGDKEDIELLNRLIQEENEFVLSCFDVFDSDKDHENLIDSLQRILKQSKAMGGQHQPQKITPQSFYQTYEGGVQRDALRQQAQSRMVHQTPQPNHSFGAQPALGGNIAPFMNSQQALPASMRPATSQWHEGSMMPGGGLEAGGF